MIRMQHAVWTMTDTRLKVRSREAAQRDIAVRALQDTLALLETMPVVMTYRAYETVRVALDSISTIGDGP